MYYRVCFEQIKTGFAVPQVECADQMSPDVMVAHALELNAGPSFLPLRR